MSDGDGESGREHDDIDSCDEIRRHGGSILADHGDVLAKLKMQVRDIKVGVSDHCFNLSRGPIQGSIII
jgi:hypothetical protein